MTFEAVAGTKEKKWFFFLSVVGPFPFLSFPELKAVTTKIMTAFGSSKTWLTIMKKSCC